MRHLMLTVATAWLVTGCVRVEEQSTTVLDARGVVLAQLVTDAGSVSYDGASAVEEFQVGITHWGNASRRGTASRRLDTAVSDVFVDGPSLVATGRSGHRAGVSFDIVGPGLIDTDLYTRSGTGRLLNVEGYHTVDASSVYGRNVVGEGEFVARAGTVDLQVFPYFDGAWVRIVAERGDVSVGLPFNYDYALEVSAHPSAFIEVEELGFGYADFGPGVFYGERGFADVVVEIRARDGDVQVYGI